MKIHRVRIKQANLHTYWYADKIGEEFYCKEVKGRISRLYDDHFHYEVIALGTFDGHPNVTYLDEDDVEILETFDGEVKEEVAISIERKR